MAKIPVTDCPAGPALDAAVAKVLGNKITFDREGQPYHEHWMYPGVKVKYVDGYSTDMDVTWELVERGNITLIPVKDAGWIALQESQILDVEELWEVEGGTLSGYYERFLDHVTIAPAPLAITRAFLLAHGVTEVEVADD